MAWYSVREGVKIGSKKSSYAYCSNCKKPFYRFRSRKICDDCIKKKR